MFENIQCFCHLISINMQSDFVSVIFCIYQLALNWSFFCTIYELVSFFLIQIFFFPSNILISKVPFGEGNGTPLQYSCLENPRDRGACQAAVYGVAQSRTRLTQLSRRSSSSSSSKVPFEFEDTNISYSHFSPHHFTLQCIFLWSHSLLFRVLSSSCLFLPQVHCSQVCAVHPVTRLSIADPVSAPPQMDLFCTWTPGTRLTQLTIVEMLHRMPPGKGRSPGLFTGLICRASGFPTIFAENTDVVLKPG